MEKNVYETYEFLPTNNSEEETDQFFVVQNDGTLMINGPVQYVAQVQDVKSVLEDGQSCSVYDVTQQYYVDVDENSELISVPDHFVIPNESEANIYANNYFLQTIPNSSGDQIAEPEPTTEADVENTSTELKVESSQFVTPNNNFTEITITDDQYRTLEEKGWVLIEIHNKVFLLNSLGIHDITDNEELILQMKNEMIHNSTPQIDVDKPVETFVADDIMIDNTTTSTEESQYILENAVVEENVLVDDNMEDLNTELIKEIAPVKEHYVVQETTPTSTNCSKLKPNYKKNKTLVRLKTNFSLKDIPRKIVLGKTANGKRLVAKVVNVKKPTVPVCANNDNEDSSNGSNASAMSTNSTNKENNEIYYKASKVENLINEYVKSGKEVQCPAQALTKVESIIKQLLSVESTRTPLIGRSLIVTRIVKEMDDKQNVKSESEPMLVTGQVAEFDDSQHFVYVPHLFQKFSSSNRRPEFDISINNVPVKRNDTKKHGQTYNSMLHVHIVENIYPNAPTKMSIAFNKKRIPTNTQLIITRKEPIHVCSTCAKLFTSADDLKVHQEARDCSEIEDERPPLIIDTDKISSPNTSKINTQGQLVTCKYCNAKIKTENYKRHLLCHFGKETSGSKTETDSKEQFQCKMCSCYFQHASSLSRHIVAQHIKNNAVFG